MDEDEKVTPGTPVRFGYLHGVVLNPTKATLPAPGRGYVLVRWEFDGYPSYSVTWERPDALTVSTGEA